MLAPAFPEDEYFRLKTLRSLGVLDAGASAELDRITRVAARLFEVPVVLVTLIDAQRQQFAARTGLDIDETPRDISFCAHAILSPHALVVPDASADLRFTGNPQVTGAPHLRFYAGQPIFSREGRALGTLCLVDYVPRQFGEAQTELLRDMAAMVEQYFHGIEAEVEASEMQRSLARTEALFGQTVAQAAVGIALLSPGGRFLETNRRWNEIAGREGAALRACTIEETADEADRRAMEDARRRLLAGDVELDTRELRLAHADGRLTWVQLTLSISRDVDGGPRHFIAVISDIDARRQMETELADLHRGLERRVEERTTELQAALERMNSEIVRSEAAQHALANERERFRSTLQHASDAVVELDEHGHIQLWNRAAEVIFGWSTGQATGQPLSTLIVPPDLRPLHDAGFARYLATSRPTILGQRIETRALRRSGEEFPVQMTLSAHHAGGRRLFNAFLQDISQRKEDEQRILESNRRLRMITDNMPALIADIDAAQRFRFHNATFAQWFDLPPQGLIGAHLATLLGDAAYAVSRPHLERAMAGEQVSFETELMAREGMLHLHATFVPIRDAHGHVDGLYVLAQDVTERKRLLRRLEHEATHDTLTGLPNRRSFLLTLRKAMRRTPRSKLGLALLFLDLDGFKRINDTHGHKTGDLALQTFASVLQASLREADTLARYAGDEFTILLEDLEAPEHDAARLARRLLDCLGQTTIIGDIPLRLSASIGIATFRGEAGIDTQVLVDRADNAMYRAKAAGRRSFRIDGVAVDAMDAMDADTTGVDVMDVHALDPHVAAALDGLPDICRVAGSPSPAASAQAA